MKIDRPGVAIIGAVLMVAFGVVGAQEALASIDFATIVLLFSVVGAGIVALRPQAVRHLRFAKRRHTPPICAEL